MLKTSWIVAIQIGADPYDLAYATAYNINISYTCIYVHNNILFVKCEISVCPYTYHRANTLPGKEDLQCWVQIIRCSVEIKCEGVSPLSSVWCGIFSPILCVISLLCYFLCRAEAINFDLLTGPFQFLWLVLLRQ